ncbi:hypothetical protein ACJX0J_034145 [Zea mays]
MESLKTSYGFFLEYNLVAIPIKHKITGTSIFHDILFHLLLSGKNYLLNRAKCYNNKPNVFCAQKGSFLFALFDTNNKILTKQKIKKLEALLSLILDLLSICYISWNSGLINVIRLIGNMIILRDEEIIGFWLVNKNFFPCAILYSVMQILPFIEQAHKRGTKPLLLTGNRLLGQASAPTPLLNFKKNFIHIRNETNSVPYLVGSFAAVSQIILNSQIFIFTILMHQSHLAVGDYRVVITNFATLMQIISVIEGDWARYATLH